MCPALHSFSSLHSSAMTHEGCPGDTPAVRAAAFYITWVHTFRTALGSVVGSIYRWGSELALEHSAAKWQREGLHPDLGDSKGAFIRPWHLCSLRLLHFSSIKWTRNDNPRHDGWSGPVSGLEAQSHEVTWMLSLSSWKVLGGFCKGGVGVSELAIQKPLEALEEARDVIRGGGIKLEEGRRTGGRETSLRPLHRLATAGVQARNTESRQGSRPRAAPFPPGSWERSWAISSRVPAFHYNLSLAWSSSKSRSVSKRRHIPFLR